MELNSLLPGKILPKQTEIVKLNIGGTKFTTSKTTLINMGDNFFSRLVQGTISSYVDEEGYYFVDRNGDLFGPILDFLRTGSLIIPPVISVRAILCEADFYSIDLSHSFCGEIKDGLYVYEASHPDERRLLFIERDPKEYWRFGVTGILKEHCGRTYKLTEFWNKRCTVNDGILECGNFEFTPHQGGIVVQQKDYFHENVVKLVLGSEKNSGQPCLVSDTWWNGDHILENFKTLQICFVHMNVATEGPAGRGSKKLWISLLKCEGDEPLGPFDVTILSDQLVIVEGHCDRFWIFIQKKNPGRLVAYNPFWKKNGDGTYHCEKGWMRFFPK